MKKRRSSSDPRHAFISLPLPADCPPEAVVKGDSETDANGFSQQDLKLGQLIRSAYIRCRSIFESRARAVRFEYKPAAVYDKGAPGSVETACRLPIWPKIANWCLANNIEPVSYITWRFVQVEFSRPPEPPQLISTDKLTLFRQNRRKSKSVVRTSLKREYEYFSNAVDYEIYVLGRPKTEAWLQVLTDGTVSISPLFRHATAMSVGGAEFTVVAKQYLASAVAQFMQYPHAYRRYWTILSTKFVKSVKRNYVRLVCNG